MTRRQLILGLATFTLATGCSSEPPVGLIVGQVTLDGKPVTGGAVSLLPAAGGNPQMADIDGEGRYRATVPAGEVLVSVISPPPDEDPAIMKRQPGAKGPPPPPKPKVVFPAKYTDPSTSGLRATVKPQAEGEVTFDIPMKK